MPANRTEGMDHSHYAWSALPNRKPLRWPGGASVAVCVLVNIEHYDLDPPPGSFAPASIPGGRGRGPAPDIAIYSLRQYGPRVGIFRVMDVLDRHGVKATAAIDAASAIAYPRIVAECQAREWDFVAHGLSVTQTISSRMNEDEERAHIRTSLDTVARETGLPIRGWCGVDSGESERTPRILAELGVNYIFDWPNDEQPYRMLAPPGDVIALPTMLELDDVYAHWHRRVTVWRWQRMVEEALVTLSADGGQSGRLLVLSLHPWLIGQAHRIRALDDALAFVTRQPGVWMATGAEIDDWFRRTC
ncbi:MAG: polysaccharide deacetylase family protein [Beijerinckiaceae bacterium]|nr:polysaccharide deacetylase family protein [Beijerinckiaceae bacterium]